MSVGLLTVLGVAGWDGQQEVAIKWPQQGSSDDRLKFLSEGKFLARFRGAGVMPLLGVGELPAFDDGDTQHEIGYALVFPYANLRNGFMHWDSAYNRLQRRENAHETSVRTVRALVRILGSGPAAALREVHRAQCLVTNITPHDIVFHRQANREIVAWMGLGYCMGPVPRGTRVYVNGPVAPWAPKRTWNRVNVLWDRTDDVCSFGTSMLHIVCGLPHHAVEMVWGAGDWAFTSEAVACREIPTLLQAKSEQIVQEYALDRWHLNQARSRMDPRAWGLQVDMLRAVTGFFLLCCLPECAVIPAALGERFRRPTAERIHHYMSQFDGDTCNAWV